MFNFFKKKSKLKEMAGIEDEPQPSFDRHNMPWPPAPPMKRPAPPPAPWKEEEDPKVCSKCGTHDCISLKEYQRRIKYTDTGFSIDSNNIFQCCDTRRQLNRMEEIEKEKPGIWGNQISGEVKITITDTTGKETTMTKSTGPK